MTGKLRDRQADVARLRVVRCGRGGPHAHEEPGGKPAEAANAAILALQRQPRRRRRAADGPPGFAGRRAGLDERARAHAAAAPMPMVGRRSQARAARFPARGAGAYA